MSSRNYINLLKLRVWLKCEEHGTERKIRKNSLEELLVLGSTELKMAVEII